MNGQYKYGYIRGNLAQNIEVGFVPSKVRLVNMSARDDIFEAVLDRIIEFNTLTVEIKAGYRVRASDGGWDGIVSQVVKTANATGFLIMEPGMTGVANVANDDDIHATEHVDVVPTVKHAEVDNGNGGPVVDGSYIITGAVAASNDTIVAYLGTAGDKSQGFSVTTTVGAAGDLYFWEAWAANCDGE